MITDRNGILLALDLTAANVHNCKMLKTMLEYVSSLRNLHGKPIYHPQKFHIDKGYDFSFCRQACMVLHIKYRIVWQGIESSSHLRKHRWVVEGTVAWFHRYRRLLVRYERRTDIYLALITLTTCHSHRFLVLVGALIRRAPNTPWLQWRCTIRAI